MKILNSIVSTHMLQYVVVAGFLPVKRVKTMAKIICYIVNSGLIKLKVYIYLCAKEHLRTSYFQLYCWRINGSLKTRVSDNNRGECERSDNDFYTCYLLHFASCMHTYAFT